jgi:hypothetical protein
MHVSAQRIRPEGHWQTPLTHWAPPEQTEVQVPQWRASDSRSMHAPKQETSPPEQPLTQRPALHTSFGPQAPPQPPQFRGSDAVSMQWSPHKASSGAHTQVCNAQRSPEKQLAPQLAQSVIVPRVAHVPEQHACPLPHAGSHVAES